MLVPAGYFRETLTLTADGEPMHKRQLSGATSGRTDLIFFTGYQYRRARDRR
jgi:hypothetical protein